MRTNKIVILLLLAASISSCRGFRPGASAIKEDRPDTLLIHKLELEENVLAALDSLTMEYVALAEDGHIFSISGNGDFLTEREKKLRPDYLMDPGITENLLTLQQKLAALAILVPEHSIRQAYGMPLEESEKAIARLAADLSLPSPLHHNDSTGRTSALELIGVLKEQGLLNYYWFMEEITMTECLFLISRNIEPFMRSLQDEDIAALHGRLSLCEKAAAEYSRYDPSIAEMLEIRERIIPHSELPSDADAATLRANFRKTLEENSEAYSRFRLEILK